MVALNALPVVVDHGQRVYAENVKSVCELVHSQEDRPHSHHSVRQIAREAHISRSSVHNIIKKDLQMKCFKRRKAQELTEANKVARRQRAKELLKKYPAHSLCRLYLVLG